METLIVVIMAIWCLASFLCGYVTGVVSEKFMAERRFNRDMQKIIARAKNDMENRLARITWPTIQPDEYIPAPPDGSKPQDAKAGGE